MIVALKPFLMLDFRCPTLLAREEKLSDDGAFPFAPGVVHNVLPLMLFKNGYRLFLGAAIVRSLSIAYLVYGSPYLLVWKDRNECVRVARALVEHHAFASAYAGAPGPTAWLAPVFPSLIAIAFFLLGINAKAALVVIGANVAFSAYTAVLIYKIGTEYFDRTTGILGGWAWAISPAAVLMPGYIWDSCLSALVLSCAILYTLRLSPSVASWAKSGAIWGFTGLTNPSLLAGFPLIFAYRLWRGRASSLKRGICLLAVFAAIIFPWIIRDRIVMGQWMPIRSNGWAEIAFGNVGFQYHPTGPTQEYQRLGEMEFVSLMKDRLFTYVRQNPKEFLAASAGRFEQFWTVPKRFRWFTVLLSVLAWAGIFLGLRNHRDETVPIAAAMIFYPAVFYISYVFARYRYPIDPLIYLMAAYAITCFLRWIRSRSKISTSR
jgi:hypothetical protein